MQRSAMQDVVADEKVLIAIRDDVASRDALEWAMRHVAKDNSSVCFLLTHVVTELRNTAGKIVRLSQADSSSVAVHICDRVLPFLEGLQDLCDEQQIPSTIHVVKNEMKAEAILEAAKKLETTHIVFGLEGGRGFDSSKTVSRCLDPSLLPPGCSLHVVQEGKEVKSVVSEHKREGKGKAAGLAFHGTAQNTRAPQSLDASSGPSSSAPETAEDSASANAGGGMSALELARQAYRANKPQMPPAPEKDKKSKSKPAVAAKARLEKKKQEREASGKLPSSSSADSLSVINKAQNPLFRSSEEFKSNNNNNNYYNSNAGANNNQGVIGTNASGSAAVRSSEFLKFSLQDLQAAIDHYWPNHVCGEGSYGVVYRGLIDGQQVAIKQLKNPDQRQALDEIEREVEVQRRIDHPNLVRLLGFCLEDRSLVYEFMSNGSLEDRLLCVGGSPPLMWPDRIRIAFEVALGLQHLHSRKPPIVHRDVKPANVLLDDNFVANLGDVGLARLMGDLAPGHSHVVRKSVIVGTEHYVDPEYLCARRGYLGPKSDVYSFGVVLLQMLVGEVPNLRKIDAAVEKEQLQVLLDPRAGDWPMHLAIDLANLGLWCAEIDRRDRPDLQEEVIPALLDICEAAAKEVIEFEKQQDEARAREKAAKEAEVKAKEEREKAEAQARKDEEERKKKEKEEKASAKAAEASIAGAAAAAAASGAASGGAVGNGAGKAGGSAPAAVAATAAAGDAKQPGCCVIS